MSGRHPERIEKLAARGAATHSLAGSVIARKYVYRPIEIPMYICATRAISSGVDLLESGESCRRIRRNAAGSALIGQSPGGLKAREENH